LTSDFVLYGTEAGFLLIVDGHAVAGSKGSVTPVLQRAREMGAASVILSSDTLSDGARQAGLASSLMSAEDKEKLDSLKLSLIVESKLAATEGEAVELIRQASIASAEEAIREASSRPDLHLVQAIQALDEADKFLNVLATRASEWYGLHFPELTQMTPDSVEVCRLITDIGRRENFMREKLEGRGLSEKKIEAILTARDRSKGGEMNDKDMERLRTLATLALTLGSERDRLNSYVESTMKKIAPNVTRVAGATIGARLMAKAGGLDRLAMLPASTIQILGAEKALFRALKTGARPPKHGILFQHQDVHMAPKWQRGKIARTIANKIAIAARIDYYRGSEEASLKPGLDKRLEQIRAKYKDPPPQPHQQQRRKENRAGGSVDGRQKRHR
jgi:nucleolar protein 56